MPAAPFSCRTISLPLPAGGGYKFLLELIFPAVRALSGREMALHRSRADRDLVGALSYDYEMEDHYRPDHLF